MPSKKQDDRTQPVWHLNVVSSNIENAAYHVTRKVLRIQFKNGKLYLYKKVSRREFYEFTIAESKGKHLNEFIKPFKECVEV